MGLMPCEEVKVAEKTEFSLTDILKSGMKE